MAKTRTYFCIDMKSFYASVECAERGYNPFETNLVVADLTRGENALCLAITPAMKAQGIRNRCRLSEIPSNVKYEVAPPRMALYYTMPHWFCRWEFNIVFLYTLCIIVYARCFFDVI